MSYIQLIFPECFRGQQGKRSRQPPSEKPTENSTISGEIQYFPQRNLHSQNSEYANNPRSQNNSRISYKTKNESTRRECFSSMSKSRVPIYSHRPSNNILASPNSLKHNPHDLVWDTKTNEAPFDMTAPKVETWSSSSRSSSNQWKNSIGIKVTSMHLRKNLHRTVIN